MKVMLIWKHMTKHMTELRTSSVLLKIDSTENYDCVLKYLMTVKNFGLTYDCVSSPSVMTHVCLIHIYNRITMFITLC
jgi:hypothetical protein